MDLLFERFISEERNEPPDIDLDIAHQEREKVLQYLKQNYDGTRILILAPVVRGRKGTYQAVFEEIRKAGGEALPGPGCGGEAAAGVQGARVGVGDRLHRETVWQEAGRDGGHFAHVGLPAARRRYAEALLSTLDFLAGFPAPPPKGGKIAKALGNGGF